MAQIRHMTKFLESQKEKPQSTDAHQAYRNIFFFIF